MSRIFITGSADGLGFLTAKKLLSEGHQVIFHARNNKRAADIRQKLEGATDIVTGNLADIMETFKLADQVNALGKIDAIIHNAGIGYAAKHRQITNDGICEIFAVNVLAPYILSAQLTPVKRSIFLSSSMYRSGANDAGDINWEKRLWNSTQAYSESKFYDTLLACALARIRPETLCNSVDPGWVPTKMGGPSAPDDLDKGYETQVWLAASNDAIVTGQLFHHMKAQKLMDAVKNREIQERLLNYCAKVTGKVLS